MRTLAQVELFALSVGGLGRVETGLASQAARRVSPGCFRSHLGASGRTAVELQAKSRHTSLRTLGRYVNPGPELAARVTAETDPARRRQS